MIEGQERLFQHGVGQQSRFLGGGQFVNIHDLYKSVGVDDDVRQKIGDDICIGFGVVIIIYDIAVPVQEPSVLVIKFADLDPFPEKIAGVAVMQIFFGTQCLPGGDDTLAGAL